MDWRQYNHSNRSIGAATKERVSPKRAALALGLSEASIKRWSDNGVFPSVRTPGGHRRLSIGGTLKHDPYSLPTLMAELALLEAGWNARRYGTGHPGATLCSALREVRPQLFWLSISAFRSERELLATCSTIQQAAYDCGAAMVVGGRALTQPLRERMSYSVYGENLRLLVASAETINPTMLSNQIARSDPNR